MTYSKAALRDSSDTYYAASFRIVKASSYASDTLLNAEVVYYNDASSIG